MAWKEYWQFLDTYTDLGSTENLHLLEDYLLKRFKNVSNTTFSEYSKINNVGVQYSLP